MAGEQNRNRIENASGLPMLQPGAIPDWANYGALPGCVLPAGTRLSKGDRCTSPNGHYELVMQNDGNLALYRNDFNKTQRKIFDTGTYQGNPYGLGVGDHAEILGDGTLAVYGASGEPGDLVWASNI